MLALHKACSCPGGGASRASRAAGPISDRSARSPATSSPGRRGPIEYMLDGLREGRRRGGLGVDPDSRRRAARACRRGLALVVEQRGVAPSPGASASTSFVTWPCRYSAASAPRQQRACRASERSTSPAPRVVARSRMVAGHRSDCRERYRRVLAVALADTSSAIVDSLPPDWTDLSLDLRIVDEERYIEAATLPLQVNAQPYSKHDWHWRLHVAHDFGHAAAPETVRGHAALLDARASRARCARDARSGRVEIVPMWGRPESVRQEFGAAGLSSDGARGAALPRPAVRVQRRGRAACRGARGHPRRRPGGRRAGRRPDRGRQCDIEALGGRDRLRTLGFYPHVQVEVRARAEAAGIDMVVPRSR